MPVLRLVPVGRAGSGRIGRGGLAGVTGSAGREDRGAEALSGAGPAQGPGQGPGQGTALAVPERKTIYEGSPSWKAFFGVYLIVGVLTVIWMMIWRWIDGAGAPLSARTAHVLVPVAAAVVAGFGLMFYRRSTKFRVTTTVIEWERGMLSKRIDVLQLWRIRDVVYKQNLVDRILGIAHVQVIASDATNPDLEIVGMPASRQLFEQLRDSIEIQRHSQNVVGVVS